MSIDKKSLISNRIANKKAIATKPQGSKIGSTKTIMPRLISHPKTTSMHLTRVAGAKLGPSKVIVR